MQLASFFIAIIFAVLALVNPWINKLLIDNVLLSGDVSGLKLICFLFAGSFLVRAVCGILQNYLYAKVGGWAVFDMRKDLYNHMQSLSIPFFHSNKTGKLIASFTSDISLMQGLYTSTIVTLITDSLQFVTLVVVMMFINQRLTWIALLCLPFYAVLVKKIGKPIREASESVQSQRAQTTGELQEKLSGMREIQAFVCEGFQSNAINSSFARLLSLRIRLTLIGSLGSLSGIISAFGLILLIWLGGNQVISGSMEIGVFIAYLAYMGRLFGPVDTFVSINNSIQIAMGAAKRVFEMLDTKPEIEESLNPEILLSMRGSLELRNVSFSYASNDINALQDVSLVVEPGQTIALVGSSGAGKTTMAMLLMRYYDPTSGSIFIDGKDLRLLKLDEYRRQIGIVFQDPFLFNASIFDNIALGNPDANIEMVKKAAEASYANEFISELPEKYETVIGERGVTLSGGQQQRLAIARVILKNPRLVILDEATSALDTESEKLVQKAMNHLLEDRTSVIIAHRLSTVRAATNIVVLQEGKIIEIGNYDQLLEKKGRFYDFHKEF